MTIEEQIRDTKGARFGFALVWTQISTPEALSRFVFLIGLAVMILYPNGLACILFADGGISPDLC